MVYHIKILVGILCSMGAVAAWMMTAHLAHSWLAEFCNSRLCGVANVVLAFVTLLILPAIIGLSVINFFMTVS